MHVVKLMPVVGSSNAECFALRSQHCPGVRDAVRGAAGYSVRIASTTTFYHGGGGNVGGGGGNLAERTTTDQTIYVHDLALYNSGALSSHN